MTSRERVSLLLIGAGATLLVIAAYAAYGWPAAAATAGLLAVAGGVLLGMDDGETAGLFEVEPGDERSL